MNARLASFCSAVLLVLSATLIAADADPYTELAAYKYGDSRKALTAIEASTRGASADQLKQIEAKLIAVLQAPNATPDVKGWICVLLRQVGSEASIAPVAALLADKDVSVRACIALQSLPGPKADEALREALPKVPAELQAGVIQTIGARRDTKAAALLAPLASHADVGIATEALTALGRIGDTEALAALNNAKVADALREARSQALLLCADVLSNAGKKAEAAGAYASVFKEGGARGVKIAALRGLVANDKAQATEALVVALKSEDARLRTGALQCLCDLADDEVASKTLAAVGTLEPQLQAVLLESAKTKAVLPTALEALKSENADLRTAAIRAIGRVGGATEVAPLLADAIKNVSDASAIQAALGALKDPKADDELIKALAQEPKLSAVAVAALNHRGSRAAFPELLKLASTCTDDGVARELGSALAGLAAPENRKELVKLLMSTSSGSVRSAAVTAVARIGKPDGSAETCKLLGAEWAQASTDAKVAALGVLPMLGDAEALAFAREQLKAAKDPAVLAAAVRCLADWPDAAPVNDLLAIAKETQEVQHNVLAIRGILRMLTKQGKRSAEAKTLLAQALEAAKRDEEKNQIKQALSKL